MRAVVARAGAVNLWLSTTNDIIVRILQSQGRSIVSRQLDQILVIDVEATCWEGTPPPDQESEIIEIGICTLDVATCTRLQKRSILVRPERSSVSKFCTDLTTLTQEQVEHGVDFKTACSILKSEYLSQSRTWAGYGDYDRRQFERQCQSRGVGYPLGPSHINVKNLFAVIYALPHEVGMAEALEKMQLPLEGTHHRGGDDAWNIALILLQIIREARTGKH